MVGFVVRGSNLPNGGVALPGVGVVVDIVTYGPLWGGLRLAAVPFIWGGWMNVRSAVGFAAALAPWLWRDPLGRMRVAWGD